MFNIFDCAALNDTLFPGYDYPPENKNAYVCSVLMLLYFVPEIQNAMLSCQERETAEETRGKKPSKSALILSAELGFLFHQINSISDHAMCHPKPPGTKEDPCRPIVGAFVPSNFLSAFTTMPEASALALLDDSAAAAEVARRPEAFYRFLLHHLDKELGTEIGGKNSRQSSKKGSKPSKTKLIDLLQGLNTVTMNEFVTGSGPPSASLTRSYTVDLSYDAFRSKSDAEATLPDFLQLLQYSLCLGPNRLRAWCDATKSYETVVQRKIITTLPTILSLSCACAGVHGEDRLPIWRKTSETNSHWLPEMIEVEIDDVGNIITRQLTKNHDSQEEVWEEFKGEGLPGSVLATLTDTASSDVASRGQCARYRLDMVLTYLNDEASDGGEQNCGRHIVHSRIPKSYKRRILSSQLENIKRCATDNDRVNKLTLLRDVTSDDFEKRMQLVEEQLKQLEVTEEEEWVLFNGPNVSSTTVDDALAFHVPFKEPCIILFRQVDNDTDISDVPKDDIWADSPLRPGTYNLGIAIGL